MDDRIKQNGAICDRCNETLTTYAITQKSRCEFDCTPEEVVEHFQALGQIPFIDEPKHEVMDYLAEHARFVPMGFEYACAGCLTEAERARFDLDGAA